MVYIGIDLGGTGIKIGVVDESGAILSQGETPTLAGRPYEDIIADMGRCMLDVMARGGFEEKDIASIGVGIPGVADEKTGHVIFCTNLGWSDVPLRTELQKYLNKPVYIDNDATVAGFAESICGVSAGCHSSVFMTLGTGVGGGIVIGGRPWSGFHGVGSEIGHIPMDIGGEPCSCGNYGCLERYCSATAVIRMGKQMVLQHPDSLMYDLCGGDVSKLTAKMVFDAAKELDDVAMKVFKPLRGLSVQGHLHHHRLPGPGDDRAGRRHQQIGRLFAKRRARAHPPLPFVQDAPLLARGDRAPGRGRGHDRRSHAGPPRLRAYRDRPPTEPAFWRKRPARPGFPVKNPFKRFGGPQPSK